MSGLWLTRGMQPYHRVPRPKHSAFLASALGLRDQALEALAQEDKGAA